MEHLYLIEVFVDKITFAPTMLEIPNRNDINVGITFGALANMEIESEAFDKVHFNIVTQDSLKREINVDSGKSYLFPCKAIDLVEALRISPLEISVRTRELLAPFAGVIVPWEWIFVDMVDKSRFTTDNLIPASVKGVYHLLETMNGTIIGEIGLFIRLSCLGQNIQTQFQIVQRQGISGEVPPKRFLFKSSNAETTFQAQKYGEVGEEEDVIPVGAIYNPADPRWQPKAPIKPSDLTAEKINEVLCKNKDCPGVQKFKEFGLGPAAKGSGLGTIYGETDVPISYGMSHTYGNLDNYGPYGVYSRPKSLDQPFIPKEPIDCSNTPGCENCDNCKPQDESGPSCTCCDPLRLSGGSPGEDEWKAPEPMMMCKDLMESFDKVLNAYKKALGPCGQVICPFAPNVVAETCKKLCKHEHSGEESGQPDYALSMTPTDIAVASVPNTNHDLMSACGTASCPYSRKPETSVDKLFQNKQMKSACGSPTCPFTKNKLGTATDEDMMEIQLMDGPSVARSCGAPKCPFPINPLPPLEPIHWDCPDPLPKGPCRNPQCPFKPKELRYNLIPKGPCGSAECPFATPPFCGAVDCPFGPPQPCPYADTESLPCPPPSSCIPGCGASCMPPPCGGPPPCMPPPCGSPPPCTPGCVCACGKPGCPSCPITCGDPDCPLNPPPLPCPGMQPCPLATSCGGPRCPFCPPCPPPGPCGRPPCPPPGPCGSPPCPPPGPCGSPSCPFPPPCPPPNPCGNPTCPFASPGNSAPKIQSSPCGNPVCPYRDPPVGPCGSPNCKFAKPPDDTAEEICGNPECPFATKKDSQLSGNGTVCSNPVCPFAHQTPVTSSGDKCPVANKRDSVCSNPCCPFAVPAPCPPPPCGYPPCSPPPCGSPPPCPYVYPCKLKVGGTKVTVEYGVNGDNEVGNGDIEVTTGDRDETADMTPCSPKTCKTKGGNLECTECVNGAGENRPRTAPCPCGGTITYDDNQSPSEEVIGALADIPSKKDQGNSQSAPVIGQNSPKGIHRESASEKAISQTKPGKGGKKQKSKYVYKIGDLYPGVNVGHRQCIIPGRNVPAKMGWLWNVHVPCAGLKPRIGWRPGAVGRTIAKRILQHRKAKGLKLLESLTPKASKKKLKKKYSEYESDSDATVAPKPTLLVKKREGCFYITMNPLKDPKTIEENENPYMDCTPMQFKITKNKDKKEDDPCFCDEGEESSSDSELDIEFTPPAGVIRPERLKRKKNVVHTDTQYDPDDFTPPKNKGKSKGKGKDKGKKGKKGKKK